jgi:hypothetical protein
VISGIVGVFSACGLACVSVEWYVLRQGEVCNLDKPVTNRGIQIKL